MRVQLDFIEFKLCIVTVLTVSLHTCTRSFTNASCDPGMKLKNEGTWQILCHVNSTHW